MKPRDGRTSRRFGSSQRLFLGGSLCVVITIIAACLAVWDLRDERIAGEAKDTKNLAVALAEQTARTIQAVDLVVEETRQMVLASGVTDPDQFRRLMGTEEVYRFLVDRMRSLPQANSVSLLDNAGKIVNFSLAWPIPAVDTSDRDFFVYWREHNDAGTFIGGPVVARVTDSWVIMITRRVSGPRGEFLGIVASVVKLQYFEDFYQAVSTEEGKSVGLFRRDGTLLARYPRVEKMIGQKISTESPLDGQIDAGGGTYRTSGYVGGEPRIVSVQLVREY